MSCNHDCNQGRTCYCVQPSRLSYRGKILLSYFAAVAMALVSAVAASYLFVS
jgi:hypothetical protein